MKTQHIETLMDDGAPIQTIGTTRETILDDALKAVCGDRDEQYGKPEKNFEVIADLWNVYLKDKVGVNAKDVALMMALFKVAREMSGKGKVDNLVDIAGYAACAAECKA